MDKNGILVPIKKVFRLGDKFGDLTIISEEISVIRKNERVYPIYKCKCKCGEEVTFCKYRLKSGRVKLCRFCSLDKTTGRELKIGDIYGDLQIISTERVNKHKMYNCRCKCGRIVTSTSAYLFAGRKKRCLNCGKEEMWKRLGKKTPIQKSYREYKCGARKRGLEFNLTFDEFSLIVRKNCNYCDAPPKLTTHAKQIDNLNGIDRVDNKRGYTIDNSVPCCRACNQLKSNIGLDVFKENIIKIYNHYILNK